MYASDKNDALLESFLSFVFDQQFHLKLIVQTTTSPGARCKILDATFAIGVLNVYEEAGLVDSA